MTAASDDFVEAAEHFLARLDAASGGTSGLEQLAVALTDLYRAGLLLEAESSEEGVLVRRPRPLDRGGLPAEGFDEALTDDLTDVRKDIEDALLQMKNPGAAKGATTAAWTFEDHWGSHALDVLRQLHEIIRARRFNDFLVDDGGDEEDGPGPSTGS